MATIRGDNGNNTIRGTDSIDRLLGLGGNDRILGFGGNDTIIGGTGNDVLLGLLGNDLLRGGDGNDLLRGGGGNDVLRGEAGDDRIFGDAGTDRIFGGSGVDRIAGGDGTDIILGQDDTDIINGGAGTDRLDGGAGRDRLIGGDGNDRLIGGTGDDVLIGGAGTDLAIYAGNFADYTITQTATGFIIDGPDGRDGVTGVEVFRFADQIVSAADLANTAPVATDDAIAVDEDGPAGTTDVLTNDTDADGDTLSVVAVEGSAGNVGTTVTLASGATILVAADGTATFNPNGAYEALAEGVTTTETISYTVSDGTDTAVAEVTVTITGSNDAPVVTSAATAIVSDGATLATTVLATDAEGDTLTYSISGGADAADFTINSTTGELTFVSPADFANPADANTDNDYEVQVTVTDGTDPVVQDLTITVQAGPNQAPVITGVETEAIDGSADASDETNQLTETAVLTDAEGNWDGGSIKVEIESGKFLGIGGRNQNGTNPVTPQEDGGDGSGLNETADFENTLTTGAGEYNFSIAGNAIIATEDITGGSAVVIGTFVNDGETDLDNSDDIVSGSPVADNVDTAFTGFTITLNGNATTDIINKLLTQIRVEDAVASEETAEPSDPSDTEAGVSQGNVTVTITDGAGGSTSFTRLLDSDGETEFVELNDDREVVLSDATDGTEKIDAGTMASFGTVADDGDAGGGLIADGAILTFVSSVAGDAINVDDAGTTYDVISGQLIRTVDSEIIGTVSGNETSNVTVTFNGFATVGDIQKILQEARIDTTTDLGDHAVTITVTDLDGRTATEEVVLDVVEDFTTIQFSDLANAASVNVTIDSNTIVELDQASPTVDLEQLIMDGDITVTGSNLIRFQTPTGGTDSIDLTGVDGIDQLGTPSFEVLTDDDLTVNAADVSGNQAFGAGSIFIDALEDTLDADLSGVNLDTPGNATANLNTATDVTFTGDFGAVDVGITGAGDVTISAAIGDEADVNHGGAGDLVVTGVDGSKFDLSKLTSTGGGDVTIDFPVDTTLDDETMLPTAGNLKATVGVDATLTLMSSQADGQSIVGDDASGAGNTGGSIVVTDLSDGDDLSGLEAGDGTGGATSGTLTTTVTQNTALDSDSPNLTNLGNVLVTVANGVTLSTDEPSVLDGKTVIGTGNVEINIEAVDTTGGLGDLDLSNITASGTKTLNVETTETLPNAMATDLGDFTVTVAAGAVVTVDAGLADGKTIAGDDSDAGGTAGGSITITGLGGDEVDLSNITAGANTALVTNAGVVKATLGTGTVTLDDGTNLGSTEIEFTGDGTLNLSIGQADGRDINAVTDGDGTVNVNLDGASNEDLSDVNTDATGSNFVKALTGNVSVDIVLTGVNLGGLSTLTANDGVPAVSDITVTLTAIQAGAINEAAGGIHTGAGEPFGGAILVDGGGNDTIGLVVNAATVTANGDNGVTYEGSAGDDTLAGTNDVDVISGGEGADTLTGGSGEDAFVIRTEADSGTTATTRDVITDFEGADLLGGDKINLADLLEDIGTGTGEDAENGGSFIGTASFSNSDDDTVEVRYAVSGDDVIVEIDTDDDGTANMQIVVEDVDAIDAQDIDFTTDPEDVIM
ncbi:MAG: Ig-like domain-containing protein [Filomicrobium sp.]